jgi:AcrR family transcriptional regulator
MPKPDEHASPGRPASSPEAGSLSRSVPSPDACCRPLRADAERNRQALLSAALELFATRGLDISLSEIARHAGVGVATAYRRYPQKDELVSELIRTRGAELLAIVERESRRADPLEALEATFERVIELQARNRGLLEIAFGGPRGNHYAAFLREHLAPLLDDVLKRAQAAGKVRTDITAADIPVLELMVASLTEFDTPTGDELWRRQLRIVLDGLQTPVPAPLPGRPLTTAELAGLARGGTQARGHLGAGARAAQPPIVG